MTNYDHEYELTTEEYIDRMQNHYDPEVRANAAWRLGRSRDFAAIEALIGATRDENGGVRVRAVESLANIRDERIVQPLIERLSSDDDPDVRDGAAKALALQGDVQGLPALIAALTDDRAMVRAQAADALGSIGNEQAVPGLVDALVQDADPSVRYACSQSLTSIGTEGVVDQLIALMQQTDDLDYLVKMMEILGKIRNPRAADVIRPLLDHDDELVSTTAEWALSILDS